MSADRRSRLRGHRLAVVRHVEPAEVLEAAQLSDATEDLAGLPLPADERHRPLDNPGPGDEPWHCQVCGGPCQEPPAVVSRETSEPVPSLSRQQVARLEALTALWERQVRLDAPPDATLLYGASRKPPVPPTIRRTDGQPIGTPYGEETITRDVAQLEAAETPGPAPAGAGPDPAPEPVPALEDHDEVTELTPELAAAVLRAPAGPPRRVSAWTSRHDPASLDYAVRDLLRSPVSIQDRILEHGPILDQGTTPPLDRRTAEACTGMAAVAAANVLELASSSAPRRPDGSVLGGQLLGLEDARRVYFRAQDLDAVSGHDYAGTSVLAVLKAGREAGWWTRYLWALGGTRDVAQVILQLGVAVVVGIPWGPSLEQPDAAGVIAPTALDGTGHALAVVGIKRAAPDGRPGPWFVLQQSRGQAEGRGGLVYLHHLHLGQLLRGVGEAGVPLDDYVLAGLGL